MKKKKVLMTFNQFGICPMCHSHMGMLYTRTEGYTVNDEGTYPTGRLFTDRDFVLVCPRCDFRQKMISTIYGTLPPEYYKLKEDEESLKVNQSEYTNPIGYVCDKNE